MAKGVRCDTLGRGAQALRSPPGLHLVRVLLCKELQRFLPLGFKCVVVLVGGKFQVQDFPLIIY